MRRLLSVILAALASLQALPARSQNPERNLIVVHGGANIAFFAAAYDNLSGTTSPARATTPASPTISGCTAGSRSTSGLGFSSRAEAADTWVSRRARCTSRSR